MKRPWTLQEINREKLEQIARMETLASEIMQAVKDVQKTFWMPCYKCQESAPISALVYVSGMKLNEARNEWYEESCFYNCPFCKEKNHISQEVQFLKHAFKHTTEIVIK